VPVDPRSFLPLRDLTFRILLALGDGELHGWGLGQAVGDSNASRVLPGQLYRTLDTMLGAGLLLERSRPTGAQPVRTRGGVAPSRFFSLTPLGRTVARLETDRLAELVAESRSRRLLKGRPS
jgi:DNA-binding PadR family transcriptional regulator